MSVTVSIDTGSTLLLDLIYKRGDEVRVAKNVPSIFTGMEQDAYVAVRIDDYAKYHYYFSNLDSATVKYIKDGKAYAFKTELLKKIDEPAPLFFFKYPAGLESYNLRKEVRAKCNPGVAAETHDGARVTGLLADISQSGCKIELPGESPEMLDAIAPGMEAVLKFTLPGIAAELSADGEVRWKRKISSVWSMGVSFTGMSRETSNNIVEFLSRNICSF